MARTKSDPTPTATTREPLMVCPYDGAVLRTDRVCPKGGGYPLGEPCPFVCPICRQPLGWHGGCFRCFGSRNGRDGWTFPGDKYELYDDTGQPITDGHHWVRVLKGPQRACSPEDNVDALNAVRRIMRKSPLMTKENLKGD